MKKLYGSAAIGAAFVLGFVARGVVPVEPVTSLPAAASLELRNVTFAYPGAEAPVLCGVSLRAEAGTTTAIITHNAVIAEMAHRVIFLADGQITEIKTNTNRLRAGDLKW